MTELMEIGTHCTRNDCNQLDFLPFKCQFCQSSYCQDHWKPRLAGNLGHDCKSFVDNDKRATVCPLCNNVVPIDLNSKLSIDQQVERHIQQGCKVKTSTSPSYRQSCNLNGCKQKSLVPMICEYCKLNHCTKHRLPQDHQCTKMPNSRGNSPVPPTATKTTNTSKPTNSTSQSQAKSKKKKDKDCIVM